MRLFDRFRRRLQRAPSDPVRSGPARVGVVTQVAVDVELLWGADWRPIHDVLSPEDGVSMGDRIARTNKAKSCALLTNQRDAVVGLWHLPAPRAPKKAFFAAQILGNLYSSVTVQYSGYAPSEQRLENPYRQKERLIYVGRAGDRDDLFCLIAVVGGLPDVDFVGTPEEVEQCLYRNTDHLAEGAVLLVEDHPVVGRAYAHLTAALMRSAEPVFGFPFNPEFADVVEPVHSVPLDKRVLTLAIAAGIAVVGSGGWFYWGQQAEEALANERRVALKAKADAARTAYLTARGTVLASVPDFRAAETSKKVWDYLASVPLKRGGFALNVLVCSGADCEFTYRRERKSATFVDFVQSHRTGERPEFDISKLDVGVTRVTLTDAVNWPRIDLADLRAQSDLLLRLGTVAQLVDMAGVRLSYTAPTPMVADALERGLPPGEAAVLRRWMGTWSLEGPSDTVVPALARMPADITLSRIELRLSADHPKAPDIVIANGRYFAVEQGGMK
jgi:hypothetical protein